MPFIFDDEVVVMLHRVKTLRYDMPFRRVKTLRYNMPSLWDSGREIADVKFGEIAALSCFINPLGL